GERFYHPDLRFQIEFPSGWRIDNTHEAVMATELHQQSRIQLTTPHVRRGITAAEYVRLIASRGPAPDSTRNLQIHAFKAVLAYYGNAIAGFIEFRDGIVQIVGVSSDTRVLASLEHSIESFDSLTDERILNAMPDRLRLYKAKDQDTLTALAERFKNPRVNA